MEELNDMIDSLSCLESIQNALSSNGEHAIIKMDQMMKSFVNRALEGAAKLPNSYEIKDIIIFELMTKSYDMAESLKMIDEGQLPLKEGEEEDSEIG
jgi:hypothetical protein